MSSNVTTHRAHDTKTLAASFISTLRPQEHAVVVALRGDLGAGKTTFVQGCAVALGIEGSVQSPTFVIEKRYQLQPPQLFTTMVHIDAYRLDSPEALAPLRFQETCADPNNLIFIEWPERIAGALPENSHTISFTFLDDQSRSIVFDPHTP